LKFENIINWKIQYCSLDNWDEEYFVVSNKNDLVT